MKHKHNTYEAQTWTLAKTVKLLRSIHITPSTPFASATVQGWDRLAQDVWEQKGRRGLFLSALSSTL